MGWLLAVVLGICGLFEVLRTFWLWREVERRTAAWGAALDGAIGALRAEVRLLSVTQSALQLALESAYAELRQTRAELDMLLHGAPGSRGP